tara:strand:+ start:23380 stop:25026 length:1647 start_codon:yes stop_codon:yes gene_type:complete
MSFPVIPHAETAFETQLLLKDLLPTFDFLNRTQEIIYGHHRFDYNMFRERIARLANALSVIGVEGGDTVAVLDWDSHRYLECFFAIPMLGAILHTVNIRLSTEQILYTINDASDKVILIHEDFVPTAEKIRDRIETKPKWILLKDEGKSVESSIDFHNEYENFLENSSNVIRFPEFDEKVPATTFYTTGTTGNPKGVCFSHRQLVIHTLGLASALAKSSTHGQFTEEDIYMPLTPMFHVHAWGMPYVATLLGVKQVYPGRYDTKKLISLISGEGITFSHCVPTILHMLLNAPEAKYADFTRWKVIIGGAALSPGLARQALDRGIDVFGGYGMSETCPVLTLAQLEKEHLQLSTEEQLYFRCKAGKPLSMVDLRIVDDNMEDLPHDGRTIGEVVVRAPWLAQGYTNNPAESKFLWRGGYLHTGDLGHIDKWGYLKVTDRLKDVIKSGGEWISSLLLEDLATNCRHVSEAAVIGLPDDKWGETPLLLVVVNSNEKLAIMGLKNIFKQAVNDGVIASWAVPNRVEIVSDIPKTSVGKIDKKLLRLRYLSPE